MSLDTQTNIGLQVWDITASIRRIEDLAENHPHLFVNELNDLKGAVIHLRSIIERLERKQCT